MTNQQNKPRLRDRPTGDLLVMMVAGTICFTVVSTGVSIIVVEFVNPQQDTAVATRAIVGVVNTLVGLLAGFLAGKTGSIMAEERRNRGS